jgi:hypothetical protein
MVDHAFPGLNLFLQASPWFSGIKNILEPHERIDVVFLITTHKAYPERKVRHRKKIALDPSKEGLAFNLHDPHLTLRAWLMILTGLLSHNLCLSNLCV